MAVVQDTDADVQHVSSTEIGERIGWDVALEAAYSSALAGASGDATVERTTIGLPGGWMRLMAASVPGLGLFGYKEFHLSADGSVRYCIHLFDLASGAPRGIVDAALVTTLRTAATAAVAVAHLVGPGSAVRLAMVGSGAESLAAVEALSRRVDLAQIRVTSRNPQNRAAFVRSVAERTGLTVNDSASVAEALADADVVYLATNSGGRVVVDAADIAGIPVIATIGSTLPSQRELPGAAFLAADRVVVDTDEVFHESGDALEAVDAGYDPRRAELLGSVLGADRRPGAGGQALYKSIGSPIQDVVLAAAIVEQARTQGFGRALRPLAAVKVNL